MILVDLITWTLFLYLAYFTLYRYVIILRSQKGRLKDIEKREYESKYEKTFTVIIYSHNNSQKVKTLVESFAKQNYDRKKYSINVILDNCDTENTKLLEILGGTKLWRINTDVKPIGKYKAYAWLLERIRAFENTNAFIFLDAECKIKSDFLEKANLNLNEESVIAGETVKRKNFLLNRIVNLKSKINNRVIRHGRFYTGLGNIIDTDALLIKQDILEKIEFETVKNGFEELEYPLKLCYYNVAVAYSSEITVFKNQVETIKSISINEYKKRYAALRAFLNNFSLLFTKTKLSVKEFIISLLYPSGTIFVLYTLLLAGLTLVYPETAFSKIISVKYLLLLFIVKLFSDFYSLIAIRGNILDYYHSLILFILSPLIFLRSIIVGFVTTSTDKKERTAYNPGIINFEKNTADVTITDGKKEFPCKLEIIKTDENAKATFIFREKKLSSQKHPRVSYAVEEIVEKLKKHGFSLKVCSNCGYFYMTESSAAHTEGEKGYCLYRNFKENSKEKEFMPVWDTCKNIIPSQARAYILQQLGVENTVPDKN